MTTAQLAAATTSGMSEPLSTAAIVLTTDAQTSDPQTGFPPGRLLSAAQAADMAPALLLPTSPSGPLSSPCGTSTSPGRTAMSPGGTAISPRLMHTSSSRLGFPRGLQHHPSVCRLAHTGSASALHAPSPPPTAPISPSAAAVAAAAAAAAAGRPSGAASYKHLSPLLPKQHSMDHHIGAGGSPLMRGTSAGGAEGAPAQSMYGMPYRFHAAAAAAAAAAGVVAAPDGVEIGLTSRPRPGLTGPTLSTDYSRSNSGRVLLRTQSSSRRRSLSVGIAPQLLAISDYLSMNSTALMADGAGRHGGPGSSGSSNRRSGFGAGGPGSSGRDGIASAGHTPGGGGGMSRGASRRSSLRRGSIAVAAAAAPAADAAFPTALSCPSSPPGTLRTTPHGVPKRCNSGAGGDSSNGGPSASLVGAAGGGAAAVPCSTGPPPPSALCTRWSYRVASAADDTPPPLPPPTATIGFRGSGAAAAFGRSSSADGGVTGGSGSGRERSSWGGAVGARRPCRAGPDASGGAGNVKPGGLKGKWSSLKAKLVGMIAPVVKCSGTGAARSVME